MSASIQKELKKLWQVFFNRLHETAAYCELLFCFFLSKSKVHLDEQTATHNDGIFKKNNYFFTPLENALGFAAVLSITQLFEDGENKKKETLSYFLSEAKKFKIDQEGEFTNLKNKHQATLKKLKNARDKYFAHRGKSVKVTEIPSSDDIFSLLDDVAELLNSVSRDFENGGMAHEWEKGGTWSKLIQRDFQAVLDTLSQGMDTTHLRKLYDTK